MNKINNQPSLSQTVEIMEEVDRRRHEEAETINHEEWIEEIKDAYQAQGVNVDENLIRTVVAEREKNAIALHEPSFAAQIMLKAYLARKRLAIIGGSALVALSLSGVGVYAVNEATLSSSASKLAFVEASRADAHQWLADKQEQWSRTNLPAAHKMVAPDVQKELSALSDLLSVSIAAPAVENRDDVLAFYEKSQKTDQQIREIKSKVAHLDGIARGMWEFDRWLAQATAPTRSWLATRWDAVKADRAKNMTLAQWTAVQANQDEARMLVEAQTLLSESDDIVNNWPTAQKDEAVNLLASADSAWKAGNVAQARSIHQNIKAQDVALGQQYTLRVASGPDVRSGVWRYYDRDQNKKSFYIIVDAVDAAGNPVTLPITNEENGKVSQTSRFGVRVPEKVYNAIRDDKTDNGIVDNNIFANKRSGTFDVSYEYDISGGTITEW